MAVSGKPTNTTKGKPMTEEEAVGALKMCKTIDTETDHRNADNIVLRFLFAQGYDEIAKAYKEVRKWYA